MRSRAVDVSPDHCNLEEFDHQRQATDYLEKIAKPKIWADDLVIGATASFLVSKIYVYTVNLNRVVYEYVHSKKLCSHQSRIKSDIGK